jgi:hypothetical protein
MSRVRDAKEDAPSIWLVSPRGKPFKHPLGLTFNSKLIKMDGGRPTLRPYALERGYQFLHDVLEPDEVGGWREYARQEMAAKGRLRIPTELLPRALQNRDTSRAKPRVFVPSAEMAAKKVRVSVERPAKKGGEPEPADSRDTELELLRAQLAAALEEKAIAEHIADELMSASEADKAIDDKKAEPAKAESKPAKKAEQKTDAI